jgi:hypothetical protein
MKKLFDWAKTAFLSGSGYMIQNISEVFLNALKAERPGKARATLLH